MPIEDVDILIIKIRELGKIETIICSDCKEYHHIGKEFFKITGIIDKDLDMIINEIKKDFKKYHQNHNIEIKMLCPFPMGYNTFIIPFDWGIEGC